GNVNIISLWDTEGGSYMQALHLSFGLGGILSPLATEPFLAKPVCSQPVHGNTNNSGLYLNDSSVNATSFVMSYGSTNIHFAYLITCCFVLSSSVPFFIIYYKWTGSDLKTTSQDGSCNKHRLTPLPARQKSLVIALLFFIFLTYCAVEDTFFGYLATFCISYLQWSSSTSSYATSLFWTTYSVGRLAGVFLIKWFLPVQLLSSFLALLIISFVGLLIASLTYSIELVWLFIALVGFAMSITFPCVFSWTHENVIEVTGVISSVFLIAASSGQMLNPLFLGYLMDNISPIWFVFILLGESCLCLATFMTVYNYTLRCISVSSPSPMDTMSSRHTEQITHM
ncbi:sodium-dependent glucose transporter 1B-like, partial [Ruditapes philippinarum]|uniref:sodium-dependent glucose transporter 1B-like n=1 Tax=Ruditapes philippinarum TaxID=129788 RepID=UPI00295BFFB9